MASTTKACTTQTVVFACTVFIAMQYHLGLVDNTSRHKKVKNINFLLQYNLHQYGEHRKCSASANNDWNMKRVPLEWDPTLGVCTPRRLLAVGTPSLTALRVCMLLPNKDKQLSLCYPMSMPLTKTKPWHSMLSDTWAFAKKYIIVLYSETTLAGWLHNCCTSWHGASFRTDQTS